METSASQDRATPSTRRTRTRTSLSLMCAGALLAGRGPGQVDAAASWVREGRFPWLEGARGHTTDAVASLDPGASFLFLETPHFRIASTLEACQPTSSEDRRRLQADLAEVRRRGVDVGKVGVVVDARARAYVYALRLENLYRDLARRVGASDADFDQPEHDRTSSTYAGEGPHFGMRQRFLVMLCEREATLERYCSAFVRRPVTHDGLRHFFRNEGAEFFGIAVHGQHTSFETDQMLHAAVVYSVTHLLVDAFKYYWHETPFWLQEGLAHWQRRYVDETAELFTYVPRGLPEKNRALDWAVSTRLRVLKGNFTPLRDVVHWLEDQTIDYGDHLAIWSRIDFLLRKHPLAFGRLMRAIKGPEPTGISYTPPPEAVVARQIAALQTVLGWTPDQFDEAWCAFVKETYPRR